MAYFVTFNSVVIGTTVVIAVPSVRIVTISRPMLGATMGHAVPPIRGCFGFSVPTLRLNGYAMLKMQNTQQGKVIASKRLATLKVITFIIY